jgi:SAM-dependent methyltransferase
MANQKVFNEIIDDYAYGRPGYPDNLFCDIIGLANLMPFANILEIGAGPGQATDFFVKNGCCVTSLEIGKAQVEYLSAKYEGYPKFRAVCSPFENYDCADGTYDLVFSATAFHWIDPALGYPKAYRILKKSGALAVFWHLESVIRQQTELNDALLGIFQKYAPELDSYISAEEGEALHEQRIAEIQTDGLFARPETRVYSWSEEYTAQRYIMLLNSYSDMHEIGEEKRRAVFREAAAYIDGKGGTVDMPMEVRLYMAIK